ncbi:MULTISPECIES: hypothetical protein [unclassified Saccharicrinis]|uniref:hypothetical protein n=1 Tax=unclassified Saccharicrinis TaxID=2646859 RepID=UPI003D32A2F9
MKIEFPLINISNIQWTDENCQEFFVYDEYYHSNDMDFLNKYILNKKYMDSKGNIFKVSNTKRVENFWWRLFLIRKTQLIFTYTGDTFTVEELRKFLMDKVSGLDKEASKEWLKQIKNAKTYKELLT